MLLDFSRTAGKGRQAFAKKREEQNRLTQRAWLSLYPSNMAQQRFSPGLEVIAEIEETDGTKPEDDVFSGKDPN